MTANDDVVERARLAFEAGNHEAAEELLLQVIADGGHDLDLWENLGTVRLARGDSTGAIEAFTNAESTAGMGFAFDQLGDTPAAMSAYRKALERDPDDVSVLVNLGILQLSSGDVDGARASLVHAAEIDLTANWALSDVYVESGDLDSSANALRVAIAAGERRAWLDLARVEHDRGNLAESEAAYQEVISGLRSIVDGNDDEPEMRELLHDILVERDSLFGGGKDKSGRH